MNTISISLTEAANRLRDAAEIGTIESYEGSIADGPPFENADGRVFVDPDDTVTVDLPDDSADGFTSHRLGQVKGLHAEVTR